MSVQFGGRLQPGAVLARPQLRSGESLHLWRFSSASHWRVRVVDGPSAGGSRGRRFSGQTLRGGTGVDPREEAGSPVALPGPCSFSSRL